MPVMPPRPDAGGRRRGGPPLATPLSAVTAGRERLRVYAVHPGALPASVWEGLADTLPGDVGLHVINLDAIEEYALAAMSTRGSAAGDPSMEFLVDRVSAAVTPPAGLPYALAGWSFGGVVAFALARTLARVGGAPGRLVLLDSIAPVPRFSAGAGDLVDDDTLIRWFGMYLCAKRAARLPTSLDLRAPGVPARLERLLAWCIATGVLRADIQPAGLEKLYRTFLGGLSRNSRIVDPYRPSPVDGPVALVKPAGSLLPGHGQLGWHELSTQGVELYPCAGDHYTMLGEVSVWALVADLVGQRNFSISKSTAEPAHHSAIRPTV
jgi:thioesterase domain-containing protein